MEDICNEGFKRLVDKKSSLNEFGRLLNEQWKVKRSMTSKISNNEIDSIYETGIKSGALGGKLLGAGGGGFMLFYVPSKKQKAVRDALKSKLLVPFRFEFTGSRLFIILIQRIEL